MANIASVINPKTYLPQSTQPLLSTPACLTIPSSHHTILSMLPPAVFIQITDLTLFSQASRPLSILTPLHWSKIFACLPSEITSVLHFYRESSLTMLLSKTKGVFFPQHSLPLFITLITSSLNCKIHEDKDHV